MFLPINSSSFLRLNKKAIHAANVPKCTWNTEKLNEEDFRKFELIFILNMSNYSAVYFFLTLSIKFNEKVMDSISN